jgi:hypothetical protein
MALTENKIKVLDIGIKGAFGAVIAALVAYYGATLQDERAKVQEENRQLQATIDLTSRQKEFDMDIGMRLFGTLMSYYFQKDKSTPQREAVRQQMLLLRLVALNFQDVPIHLKPLFEELESQLSAEEEKQVLRDIAREVARRQAYRLTAEGGYDSGPQSVKSGDELSIPNLLVTVKIESVSKDRVRATIHSKAIGDRTIGPFTVTYFDTPLVDNTKLGEYRVALVLRESGAEKAEVRFVAFPKHLAADRFDIKDAARIFRDRR